MAENNQSILDSLKNTLLLLISDLVTFARTTLLPLAGFIWHSLADLFELLDTGENRARLQRLIVAPLMRLERRLESLLPDSFKHQRPIKTVGLLLLILTLLLISGDTSVEDLQKSGELVVISRESANTLYRDGDGPAGPEYDYLESFADFLGVELRFDFRDSNREVLDAISSNEGHIATAGMTFYPPLEDQGYVFGPGYQNVDIQVVCRRNHGKNPVNIEELSDVELVVVADSQYESRLFELQQEFPDLTWESAEDSSVEDLLQLVWRKQIDCTIANSSELNIKRRFYPELQVAFTIEEQQALAWNLSPEWEVLSDSIEQWLEVIENDGTLTGAAGPALQGRRIRLCRHAQLYQAHEITPAAGAASV